MELNHRNQAIVFLWIVLVILGTVSSVVDASSMQLTIAERAFSDEYGPIWTDNGFVIPLELATLFGAEVRREGTTVFVQIGQSLLEMEAGNPTVRIGSGARQLPAAPVQLGGSFYVPLRFFADFLGLKVSWNGVGDTLDISPWSSLGGSSRQQLAAFRTIDEALQMIEDARRQIALPEESQDDLISMVNVVPTTAPDPVSVVAAETKLAAETAGDRVSDVALAPPRDPVVEVAPAPALDPMAEVVPAAVASPAAVIVGEVNRADNVVMAQPSVGATISAQLTVPPSTPLTGQLATQVSAPQQTQAPSQKLSVETSAREIAAAIARLLVSDGARDGESGVEPLKTEATAFSDSAWPLLTEVAGVSLVKEVRDGQHVYHLDSETQVVLSASMLIDPFRLIVDVAGVDGHVMELPVGDRLVEKIRAVDHDGHLRLIFDMNVGVGHTLVQDRENGGTLLFNRPLNRVSAQSQDLGGHIWLDVDPATPFTITRLPDPERWMIDLQGVSVLTPERLDLAATGPLASVRSAQFLPDVARVVLDLNKDTEIEVVREQGGISLYYGDQVFPVAYHVADAQEMQISINHASADVSVFRLLSPDRLVVDVKGLVLPGSSTEQVFMQGPVSRLRVSQYDETTARIVADLRHHVMYGLKHDQGRTVVVMRQPTLEDRVIVLDAGHGGIDGGAVGRNLGVLEKDVNLDITFRLAKLVEDHQGVPLLTRPDDAFYDLWSRPRMANNWGADVFVSIHSNTAEIISSTANGTEVYVKTDEPEDMLLGQRLLEGLVSALGTRDRGVRENRYLVVRNAEMPAALVEIAFLSDEVEEALLSEPWFRQRAAEGILNGLLRYFNREEQVSEEDLASLDISQAEWTSMGGHESR